MSALGHQRIKLGAIATGTFILTVDVALKIKTMVAIDA